MYHTEAPAQVVCRLAKDLGAFRLHPPERGERRFQIGQATRGFDLLQARVLRRAFAHAVGGERRQLAAGVRARAAVELGVGGREHFQLVDKNEVQVPPLAHQLALAVALLPAHQAMSHGAVALVARGIGALVRTARAQPALEGVENLRNMVEELRARERRYGRQLGVGVGRRAPALQDGGAARRQRRGD